MTAAYIKDCATFDPPYFDVDWLKTASNIAGTKVKIEQKKYTSLSFNKSFPNSEED